MAERANPVLIDLRGGRSGGEPLLSSSLVDLNQCAEAVNVDFSQGMLGRKRGGAAPLSLAGGTAPTYPINALTRYVPGKDETAAELWLLDNADTPLFKRLAGGVAWADVACVDAVVSAPQEVMFAVFNSKLFIAYPSAVDRLHVYSPRDVVPMIRRVGIDPGAVAPTAADAGSGSYTQMLRYYRVRFLQYDPSVTIIYRESEPTPSVTFTNSGSGASVDVTRPTAPGEQETHWVVEGSIDNSTFYNISGPVALGTTDYSDSVVPTSYPANLSDALGTYVLPTSVRFIVSDGNRLIMVGANMPGGQNSRIYWTPVLGSGNADDERIPIITTGFRYYTDVGENDGGAVTALGGPCAGSRIYAFKYRAIWILVPTGDPTTPYLQRKYSIGIGCIEQSSVVLAYDNVGAAAVYFLSEIGPYRIGTNGLEFLGYDMRDIWDTVNLNATVKVSHGLYYPGLRQVWWWIAVGTEEEPQTTRIIYDIRQGRAYGVTGEVRRGWSLFTGISSAARCSTLFSKTVGAHMSKDLVPYAARNTGGVTTLLQCDTADVADDGSPFQAYVVTPPLGQVDPSGTPAMISQPVLTADPQSGVEIELTIIKDFGVETRKSVVNLTPQGGESLVIRTFFGGEVEEAKAIQLMLGDAAPSVSTWTLQQLMIPVMGDGADPIT